MVKRFNIFDMKRIACHQPNFFPHMGFFRKLLMADVFVFLDHVQFSRRSYTQRTLIKVQHTGKWLTVPVIKKGRYYQKIADVRIDNTRHWKKDHLMTFFYHYRAADYFDEVFQLLKDVYSEDFEFLMDFNMRGIMAIMSYLGINKEFVFSSELRIDKKGSEKILGIVKSLGGSVYVSGEGGGAYLVEEEFEREGISIEFYPYPEPYPQLGFGFIKGLSIVDALFNIGMKTRRLIEP